MYKDFSDIKLKIASPRLEDSFIDWIGEESYLPKSCISSIYYAAWKEDYSNARSWMNPEVDTWDKYTKLLKKTKDAGVEPEVLLQGNKLIRDDIFKKYLDLGICKYTISDDASAYRLKELDQNVFISASITKALSPDEIKTNDYSMYDEICLFFHYTLALSTVKELPTKYEYSMCGNSGCLPICRHCVNHWYSGEMYECQYNSERESKRMCVTYNYATYKKYFSKYISRVKLLDRLSTTQQMISDIKEFFENPIVRPESYYDQHLKFPNIYNKGIYNRKV